MQAANPPPPPAHAMAKKPAPFTAPRRGRPPNKTAPQPSLPPQTADAVLSSIEPQPEKQPSSNSTSPQLANVVTGHETADHGTSLVTVFPSPTPSEENEENVDTASAPPPLSEPGPADLGALELNAGQAAYVPDAPLEAAIVDLVRGVTRGQKRRHEEDGAQVEKRFRGGESGQERPTTLASASCTPTSAFAQLPIQHMPRRTSVPHAPVRRPQAHHPYSRSPSLDQLANHALPNSHLAEGHQGPRAPPGPPDAVSRDTPQTLSTPVDSIFPQDKQHVQPQSAWYTDQECLYVMSQFERSYSIAPDHPRDGKRLSVLKNAIKSQDWPYLIMHQLYCLLDFNSNLVPETIRTQPGLDQALHLMSEVLDENKHLSPTVLHFFANYPYPLDVIATRWPASLGHQTQMFKSFVTLSRNYEQLKLTCERRRFPPLAWELAHYLGLRSTTFQLLLFTAALRRTWRVPQNNQQLHYEGQATQLFLQNQNNFYRRVGDARLTNQQLRERNESDLRHYGALLRQVVEEFERASRYQGHEGPPTHTATSPYLQQQPSHVQQQPLLIQQQPLPIQQQPPYVQQQPPQIPQHPHLTINASEMSRAQHAPQPRLAQPGTNPPRVRVSPGSQPGSARMVLPSQPHTQAVPTAHSVQSRAHVQQQQTLVALLPPPGWIQPQQRQPSPARFGLHQANLRSPVMKACQVESPLYHYVQEFIKPPARLLNANRAVARWTFTLDAETMRCIAATVPGQLGDPDQRVVDTQSKTVRVRCIKWPSTHLPSDHAWASTDTSWIPHSYFILNGSPLQQRKKIHHGKDLPIDVTGLVKEGENLLEMTVMASSKDLSFNNYLVAIESLGIISHDSVKQYCLEKTRIPAQQVLSNIKSKLQGFSEDDEIAIVESNLTIHLFDPFSASRICDIPVRSKACLHNDCFDLETFLTTRRRHGDVAVPDTWRCPICNVDARPQHLVVDGFLEEVKQQLDAQNLSNTRDIVVHQDGTWTPKAEVRDPNGVSDRDMSDELTTPTTARASIPKHVEVIDLSD
jgi:hypothetical protein